MRARRHARVARAFGGVGVSGNLLKRLGPVVCFAAGMVTAINLTQLIETNQNYDAQWWKVVFAVTVALVWGFVPWPGSKVSR